MNILFDFNHPVDVNFFKNAILILKEKNHKIFLTFRPRGSLEKILKYELPNFPTYSIGKHGTNFVTKLLYNLIREKELLNFYRKHNIELTCAFGPLTTISSKIFGIPSLAFEDDYEYKINFYYAKLFATRHIMPKIFPVFGKNVYYYNGFKELAYLHPEYYSPDIRALSEYSLKPYEYIFIREVSDISLNYKNKKNYLNDIINTLKKYGEKIVLSLENKELKKQYENSCIILKEPVKDINSILAFSALTISSGDTMARESALLGTPVIYTGNRNMLIHKPFYQIGIMSNKTNLNDIILEIENILNNKEKYKHIRKTITDMILNRWDNMTEVILKHIRDFIK